MSITFPSSPTTGQTAAVNGRTYSWNGSAWDLVANVTGHAATHATGGSDAITPASIGAAATSHAHSAADITSGTLSDSLLSSAVALHSQVNTTLGQASATVDSMPRSTANGTLTANSGLVVWSFFTPTVSMTVSQITMSSTGGAVLVGGTLARMGLYTYPTDGGTATLVARTASDTTLFTATNTAYTRSFATAGGYPAEYTLQAGTRYGAAYICVGSTPPAVIGRSVGSAIAALSPRLSGLSSTGQTDLPTSFTPLINGAAHFARFS